jgi:hypothetical protein
MKEKITAAKKSKFDRRLINEWSLLDDFLLVVCISVAETVVVVSITVVFDLIAIRVVVVVAIGVVEIAVDFE